MSTAKFDPKRPVQLKDGRKARIIATDINSDYPIAAAVSDHSYDGREVIRTFTSEGKYVKTTTISDHADLVNIIEKAVVYYNVYRNENGLYTTMPFKSRAEADKSSNEDRVGRLKFTLTEGRFDE